MKNWFWIAALLMSGCASVYCPDGIFMRVSPNAPSKVAVKCVGDDANRAELESPEAINFSIQCPAGVAAGTMVAGVPCVP